MADFTENDLRAIERDRDLPPEQEPPEWVRDEETFAQARLFLQDAIEALKGEGLDPEDALHCAREAIARIEAAL